MAQPTTAVLFSGTSPAAPPGNQLCTPQTDGGQPAQIVSFVPKLATTALAGSVRPDGTTLAVDVNGVMSVIAPGTGTGGGTGSGTGGGFGPPVVPAGAKDGSNTQYTIPSTVLAGTGYQYVTNGVVERQLGIDATFAVQGTQLTRKYPLQSNDWHEFYYTQGGTSSETGGGGSVTPLGSPTFIQGNSNYGTGTSLTCSFATNNSAGSCLIVDAIFQENFAGAGSLSVSDSQGNTYAFTATHERDGVLVKTWYALNCAGGPNTVTVTYSTSTTNPGMAVAIHEYGAVKAVSAFDIDAYGYSDGAGPIALSLTTTVAGDLLHLYVSCKSTGGTAMSNSSAWGTSESNNAGAVSLITFDALAIAAGAVSNTITSNNVGSPIFLQAYLLALKSI